MSDIVQKGLNLQVGAEDVGAVETISSLADVLDELQARAQSVFDAIAMSAEDAASALADASNLFAPEWESQFEGLQTNADGAFADMQAQADAAASQMTGAAESLSGAWTSAFDAMKSGSESAVTTLDGLQGDMETTAETAQASADEIGAAYSGDALKLGDGAAALESLQGEMEATAGVAGETAGEISTAWGGDALTLDGGMASLETLQGGFDETAMIAEGDALDVAAAWDAESLGLDAGGASLKTLQGQMNTTATNAKTAAGKISDAFGSDSLTLDDAKGSLTALQGQMDDAAATAKADAQKISDAYAGVDISAVGAAASTDAAAAAGAAGGVGAGDVPGIKFGKTSDGKAKGFSLPTPSLSNVLTGGITAALGLGGVDIAISQLEGLESLKAQTGMDWQQTLTTAAAAKGIGLDQATLQKLISRLDTNIGKLQQKDVIAATAEGKQISFGMGREAIDPATLKAVQNSLSGSGGAALALKTLGIGPSQLTGMNAAQQLALIAEKLDELKKANSGARGTTLANTIISELFGRGTETAVLLEKFTTATVEAQKNLPKGLAKDLQLTLGNGGKSMVDLQEQMFYLEVEMSASLMKLVPLMSAVLGEAAKHTRLLADIALGTAGAGVLDKIAHVGGSKSAASEIEKILKGLGIGGVAAKVGKTIWGKVRGGAGDVVPEAGDAAGAIAGDSAGSIMADVAGKALGPIGVAISSLAFPSDISNDSSAFATMWKKLVAPHTAPGQKFSQKSSISAVIQAADVMGVDPRAMLADSFAEDRLNTHAVDGKTGASGLFQFMPKTWASDTKQLLGQSIGFSYAQNPYVASMIAAAEMAKMGTGKFKGESALKNMIGDLPGVTVNHGAGFEHPGAAGARGDLARGLPFLQALLGGGRPADVAQLRSPIGRGAVIGRPDQGVDLYSPIPYKAIADGIVEKIGKFGGGSNTSVYEKLKHPISVDGHKYGEVYYAETTPMVKLGQHLKAGQNVTGAGYAELGFASNKFPAGPLIGGLGKGTKPTPQGEDFKQLLGELGQAGGKSAKSASDEIEKLLKAMETDIRHYNPKFSKALDASLLALLHELDKYRPEFSKKTDQALAEMESYLRAGKDPMSVQGEQLMLGLLDGIRRREPAVLDEVRRLVATVEAEMRKATQTHSPSELTARIGDDLMAGLTLGMRRSTAETAQAAGAAAVQVTGPLGSATAPAGAGGRGEEYTIILQLDGAEIARNVARRQHMQTKLVAKFN